MKNILVAVDGSEPASHALAQAARLARATSAKLHLAYAVPLNLLPVEITSQGMAELMTQHRAWGNLLVEKLKAELPTDVTAVTHVRDGAPVDVINEMASDVGADLVVVGNTGRGATGRFLLGSTADRLVHTSKRPVLVVR